VIDVFIRTTTAEQNDALRKAFFDATVARWDHEPTVLLHILYDKGIREGRMEAEFRRAAPPGQSTHRRRAS